MKVGTGKAKNPVCRFCRREAWLEHRRHGGMACPDCGVLYSTGVHAPEDRPTEWFLDRVEDGTLSVPGVWKHIPRGCMLVLGKWSWEEGARC